MYSNNHYVIDWNKVHTAYDIVRILKAMDITFEEDSKNIDSIKRFVVLVEKSDTPLVTLD